MRDDAQKITFLSTTDGVAILAYSGLGSTVRGTQPADWMGSVLRGRNWPLEQALGALADALKRELPQHLVGVGLHRPSHHVLVSGFVNNQPRSYAIELVISPDRTGGAFRFVRCFRTTKQGLQLPLRFSITGSGAAILTKTGPGAVTLAGGASWRRHVLRLVKAYDHHRVSAETVADALAEVNYQVSQRLTDGTVGPRCIVAWRNRPKGVHKGGGAHRNYTGTVCDRITEKTFLQLPTISNGMDLRAIIETAMPHMLRHLDNLRAGDASAPMDGNAINADLSRLPETPDEQLR